MKDECQLVGVPTAIGGYGLDNNKRYIRITIKYESEFLKFWYNRRAPYSLLAPIAEDLLSAPTSQAYVERIFPICG